MKYAAVSALLAANAVQGYLIPPNTHKIDWRFEQKRQIIASLTQLMGTFASAEKRRRWSDSLQAREARSPTRRGRLAARWLSRPMSRPFPVSDASS
jgi:hypothetical protein